ncbi:MAG TPA: 2-C-methyl-D-erythritol 2,4-cyclodiphosphate synthase [Bacteroidota bacterium]|nr:2-C-methyl-D-erythritol 2,4-cyclodiphosphate synthase [Bacteroidota bacterium]
MNKVGFGFDVHRLVSERRLILGGVEIPSAKGLLGHSDADVLLHAIADALLGAAALGDIGNHFPDTDSRYKDISSLTLLENVRQLLAQRKLEILNVDSTVVLQSPKIAPFVEQMRTNIAAALHVNISQVSVKATTNEGLGFIGSSEGAVAYAVALINTPK